MINHEGTVKGPVLGLYRFTRLQRVKEEMTTKAKLSKLIISDMLPVGGAILNAIILFPMMEIANRNVDFMQIDVLNVLINISTYFALIMVLWIITGKWGIGCGVISLVFAILGIINLYSLEFREMC